MRKVSHLDLSKFSPRAIKCLEAWLELNSRDQRVDCPFELSFKPYRVDLTKNVHRCCLDFCDRAFPNKLAPGKALCPCYRYSRRHVISVFKAIIGAKS